MNTIRNKGCFSNWSHALEAPPFLPSCLLPHRFTFFWGEKGWVNAVIVIVFSFFALQMRLLLTCKYFRFNWAK